MSSEQLSPSISSSFPAPHLKKITSASKKKKNQQPELEVPGAVVLVTGLSWLS